MRIKKNVAIIFAVVLVFATVALLTFTMKSSTAYPVTGKPCTDDCSKLGKAIAGTCSPPSTTLCTEGTGGNALCACEYECGAAGTITRVEDCQSVACNGGSCAAGITPATNAGETSNSETQAD
jgi:hypothetical protein